MIYGTAPEITVALITSVAALMVVVIPLVFAQRRTVKKLHDDVRTNHGKRPGEYLEMIEDLVAGQRIMSAQATALMGQLADHTIQDAVNFAALEQRLKDIKTEAHRVELAD